MNEAAINKWDARHSGGNSIKSGEQEEEHLATAPSASMSTFKLFRERLSETRGKLSSIVGDFRSKERQQWRSDRGVQQMQQQAEQGSLSSSTRRTRRDTSSDRDGSRNRSRRRRRRNFSFLKVKSSKEKKQSRMNGPRRRFNNGSSCDGGTSSASTGDLSSRRRMRRANVSSQQQEGGVSRSIADVSASSSFDIYKTDNVVNYDDDHAVLQELEALKTKYKQLLDEQCVQSKQVEERDAQINDLQTALTNLQQQSDESQSIEPSSQIVEDMEGRIEMWKTMYHVSAGKSRAKLEELEAATKEKEQLEGKFRKLERSSSGMKEELQGTIRKLESKLTKSEVKDDLTSIKSRDTAPGPCNQITIISITRTTRSRSNPSSASTSSRQSVEVTPTERR